MTAVWIVSILLMSSASAADSSTRYEPAQAMGLPFQTSGTLEVRLWNPGMLHPFKLVRVIQSSVGATGEVYWWDVVTGSPESTSQKARRESERMLTRGLRQHCDEPIQRTGDTLWCRELFKKSPAWPAILEAIRPDRLWPLRSESQLGDRSCCIEDGEGIVIELIEGDRYHQVEYWNPGELCPWAECAIANAMLQLVHERP